MKSNLQVRPVITDREIEVLAKIQAEYRAAKEQMERLKSEMDDYEANLVAQLDDGAAIACHRHLLYVRETERRFPAWKEHFIEFVGKEATDRVLNATEPKLYRNLVIKAA